MRVLIVDDDPDIREIATFSLNLDPQIEVRTAESGARALEIIGPEDWRPDVLLLDVMMPEIDGPSLLRQIREMPGMAEAPAIFVTAGNFEGKLSRHTDLGVFHVLPKPFDPLTLANTVRRIAGLPAPPPRP